MDLSVSGESRVRGDLFVLERSLRTFLSSEQAGDAVRGVESHIRDRAAGSAAAGSQASVEKNQHED